MTGGVFRKGPLSETYGTGLPMGGSVAVAGRSDVGPRHRERGVCEETRCRRVGPAPGRKNGLKASLLGWNMLEEAQFLCYGPCGLFSQDQGWNMFEGAPIMCMFPTTEFLNNSRVILFLRYHSNFI